MKIFVVGCGGWGMALSILLHENGHEVTAWSCFEEECRLLKENRGNEKLLPGVKLPEEIGLTTDLSGAAEADIPRRSSCLLSSGKAPRLSMWARDWTGIMATAVFPKPSRRQQGTKIRWLP